jgi:lysozyme family protein
MQLNFDQALTWVLEYEGGFSNDPHDPGGATMWGIIQREYDTYRKAKRELPQSVSHISIAERDEIYRKNYWDVMDCDDLPAGIDACAFDAAVNSGPGRAKQWLAASGRPASIDVFCDHRLAFLKGLSTWRYFGKGWAARVELVRKRTKALAALTNSPTGETTQTKTPTKEGLLMATAAIAAASPINSNPVIAAAVKAATAPLKSIWTSVTGIVASVSGGAVATVLTTLAPNLTTEIIGAAGIAFAVINAAAHVYTLITGQIANNNATIALAENLLNEIVQDFGQKPFVFDNSPNAAPAPAAAS